MRDFSEYYYFKKVSNVKRPSLRTLAEVLLGMKPDHNKPMDIVSIWKQMDNVPSITVLLNIT